MTDAGTRTWVRWQVLAALFVLSFLTIIDRVCISAAKQDIGNELKVSNVTFGAVFGAFALGYAMLMLPSGWAADKLGARRFLTIIVVAWSVFTLLTGLVKTVPVLIAVRLAFGAAESGAYPTSARAIYNWLPASERGLALGLLNTGSRVGAAIGLSVTATSIAAIGWRASFLILGVAGCAWAVWWYRWYRDQPSDKSGMLPAELTWIRSGTITAVPVTETAASLWSSGSVILVVQYFASNFTFFLCFSWLLPYLQQHFGLSAQQAGFYASVPLYCGAIATWTSGVLVDYLFRRDLGTSSRRIPGMMGFGLAALSLVAATQTSGVGLFLFCFSLTTFGVDFTLSPSWSTAADLGGSRTGTVSAAMNMFGSLGAFMSSLVFPWLLRETGSITAFLVLAAALDLGGLALWGLITVTSGGAHTSTA